MHDEGDSDEEGEKELKRMNGMDGYVLNQGPGKWEEKNVH